VNPDVIRAQMEGGIAFGLSAALYGEVTLDKGAVQQTNFHQYRVMRMSDMPEIHTQIIVTDNAPTGLGELGVPTVAPAIGNAVFKLTGKRLRQLPMSPQRVTAVLKA
jgi:isoquinoline 1-oxidoreductase beta subunit